MQMQIEEESAKWGDKLCIIYGETDASQKTQKVKNVEPSLCAKKPKKSIHKERFGSDKYRLG